MRKSQDLQAVRNLNDNLTLKTTESLPNELGLLNKLTYLDLSAGFLKGSIPTTLGMLQELGKSKFVPIVVNFFSGLSCHSNSSPLASLVTFSFQSGTGSVF